MYAIKIADDGRLLHATDIEYATDDHIIVESLPEGENIAEYLYINGAYVHEPDPQEEPETLSLNDRVSALERSMPAPAEFVTGKYYYRGDKITHEGLAYCCVAPSGVVCVWSPTDYPAYWEVLA